VRGSANGFTGRWGGLTGTVRQPELNAASANPNAVTCWRWPIPAQRHDSVLCDLKVERSWFLRLIAVTLLRPLLAV